MATHGDKFIPEGGVEAGKSTYQENASTNPGAHPQHQPTSYPHPSNYHHSTQYPHSPVYPQQQQQQPAPNYQLDQVTLVPFHAKPGDLHKSTTMAVILCVPILGLLGLHHFYLNRPFFGLIYFCTVGLFALGWLIDWFRIKSLVRKCNQESREAQMQGYQLHSTKFATPLTKLSLCDAYMLWLPPVGLLGFYQYYLGRKRVGAFHTLTLGRCVLGWLFDFCRLPSMVRKANVDIALMKKGVRLGEDRFSVCDAYTMAIPLGIFGLHHFYLGNTKRGLLFLCTAGVFGLGWLADLFQMPMIVSEANKNKELSQRLTSALEQNNASSVTTTTVVVMSSNPGYQQGPNDTQGYIPGPNDTRVYQPGPNEFHAAAGGSVMNVPPPAYREEAAAGESVVAGGSSGAGGMAPVEHDPYFAAEKKGFSN